MAGCFERANKRRDIRCFFFPSLIRYFADRKHGGGKSRAKRGFNQNGNKVVFHSIMHLSVPGHQKTCCFPPRYMTFCTNQHNFSNFLSVFHYFSFILLAILPMSFIFLCLASQSDCLALCGPSSPTNPFTALL